MIEKENVIDNFNVLFGKISGKDKLEDQVETLESYIVELEIDIKRLQTRLEKRDHISKTSVSAKQELEFKLNEANIKIETLMHERNELKKEASGHIRFRGMYTLYPLRFSEYLSQIKSLKSDSESLITAYIPKGQSLSDLKNSDDLLEQIDKNSQHLMGKIDSQNGYVLFYDTFGMVREAVAPVFPLKDSEFKFGKTFDVKKLKHMADKDVGVFVVIVHAGESFMGFADKNGFEKHQIIRSSVKAKHTKGGFSQGRFEKLRDEDIAHHIEKVRKMVTKVLDDNVDVNNIDYIITSGDQQLVKHVMDGLADDIPVIEKTMDVKIDKHNTDAIFKNALSSRRHLL